MYRVMARHWDEGTQVVFECKTKQAATHLFLQQAEILKGYFKRTFTSQEGHFICVERDEEGDFYRTQLWVERVKINRH